MNTALRSAFQPVLSAQYRSIDDDALNELVSTAVTSVKDVSTPENRRNFWELLLRQEVLKLAATEKAALKDPETTYYNELQFLLDLVLTFTEHEACDNSFPLNVLEELLEAQTVASCPHVFSWIEARSARLCAGMVPNKGKALILLRMLNDLKRRLSKTGGTTTLNGRILTFLSGVFPLGERSGVNLRGEYGPTWEGVRRAEAVVGAVGRAGSTGDEEKDTEMKEGDTETMEVDEPVDQKAQQKAEFYETFWSLQLPFSRPATFTQADAFTSFREATEKVLPVIKEASAKERAMMGSKSGQASLKRKRAPDAMETDSQSSGKADYFFAKFLTSPELLDLEIADVHFRRQVLFQLLITIEHALSFTKTTKATWTTPRNRSLQLDFTLSPEDAQWAADTRLRVLDEIRHTAPAGRAAADSARAVLARERNWVKWKNELCAPFDKPTWYEEIEGPDGKKRKVGLEEATSRKRKQMRAEPPEWEYELGSRALTDLWAMGFRDLRDLETFSGPGDLSTYVKRSVIEDRRLDARRKALAQQAERLAAARAKAAATVVTATPPPTAPKKDGEDVVMEPVAKAESTLKLETPTSIPTSSSSPLHPSLPAKPGSSPGPRSSPGPTPAPTSAPTPAPVPSSVSAPLPTPAGPPTAAAAQKGDKAPPPPLVDEVIARLEEAKSRVSWLGLRATRDTHLAHFGKADGADLSLLANEVERARRAKEREDAAAASGTGSGEGSGEGERSQSLLVSRNEGKEREDEAGVREDESMRDRDEANEVKEVELKKQVTHTSSNAAPAGETV